LVKSVNDELQPPNTVKLNTDFSRLPKNVRVNQSPCYPKSWKNVNV